MNLRQRRLYGDYQKVREDFDNHKYITVTPVGQAPYEKYSIVYNVSGLYWDENRNQPVERKGGHQVEITLPLEYPRGKPHCKILTPIFHPNFGRETICIGDYWAASSTLGEVIIKIGEMLQYQDYNVKSPFNQVAARWAMENERFFPVSNIALERNKIEQPTPTAATLSDDDDLVIVFNDAKSSTAQAQDKGSQSNHNDDDLEIILN